MYIVRGYLLRIFKKCRNMRGNVHTIYSQGFFLAWYVDFAFIYANFHVFFYYIA